MKKLRTFLASSAALSLSAVLGLKPQMQLPVRDTPRKKKVRVAPEKYKALVHYRHKSKRQRLLNKLTNWQRNQAGKACKGAWERMSLEQLEKFTNLPHWKQS